MTVVAPDGFMDVPAGKVATIVTSLEMTKRPCLAADARAASHLGELDIELHRIEMPALDWYRCLFRKVGEEWLWFSRLRLGDGELASIIHDPATTIHLLRVRGEEAGILELDFRTAGACEIAFFGVAPQFVGRGLGGYLMRAAVEIAWAQPIDRLWVHTCTLDHASALQFYRKMGFRAYRQQVEIADDPRVLGELPRSRGQHIPIFDPA